MYFIKALPPLGSVSSWNYTRFGKVIPKETLEVGNLKKFFADSPLTEEKLLQAMRDDTRVQIETVNDKEANEKKEAIVGIPIIDKEEVKKPRGKKK